MIVQITTAGTTILIEFQKYGRRPVGSTPIWAVLHALSHGSIVQTLGKAIMLPPVISPKGLTEFTTMMKNGSR